MQWRCKHKPTVSDKIWWYRLIHETSIYDADTPYLRKPYTICPFTTYWQKKETMHLNTVNKKKMCYRISPWTKIYYHNCCKLTYSHYSFWRLNIFVSFFLYGLVRLKICIFLEKLLHIKIAKVCGKGEFIMSVRIDSVTSTRNETRVTTGTYYTVI